MNHLTRVFLVLLRLAIGWLFVVEGLEKVKSFDYAADGRIRPWTSASYLRESSGPASSFFHWQMGGNADELATARLTLQPPPEVAGGLNAVAPRKLVSPDLADDWRGLTQRTLEHYGFDDDQRIKAQEVLDRNLDRAARWIGSIDLAVDKATGEREGTKEVENTVWPTASFKAKLTFAERIAVYRKKLAELQEMQGETFVAFGRDVAGGKLRTMKSDASKLRTELLADLEEPLSRGLAELRTSEQAGIGALPRSPQPQVLVWTDRLIPWSLLIMGGGLLLGLFTRLNCFAGAVFLLMLYAAMPAWPWLPENIKAEGHYLFVNKNVILALGLLVLATTRSGRWFGLDGLLHALISLVRGSPESGPEARRTRGSAQTAR